MKAQPKNTTAIHPTGRLCSQSPNYLFPPEIFTNSLTVLQDPFAVGEFDP
jgi:hypothetical protein